MKFISLFPCIFQFFFVFVSPLCSLVSFYITPTIFYDIYHLACVFRVSGVHLVSFIFEIISIHDATRTSEITQEISKQRRFRASIALLE